MTERVIHQLESVTIRFAGDSGDGMQLTGSRFTDTAALIGNDVATFPDFPAEIRAPAGSLPGSADSRSVQLARHPHAGRPARRAGRDEPGCAEDEPRATCRRAARSSVERRRLHRGESRSWPATTRTRSRTTPSTVTVSSRCPCPSMTVTAVEEIGLGRKAAERCKNFFALGMLYLLYERPIESDRGVDPEQVRQGPRAGRGERPRASRPATTSPTRSRSSRKLPGRKAQMPPGNYRIGQRQPGDGVRPRGAPRTRPGAALLRQLPDHAGERHPARAARACAPST